MLGKLGYITLILINWPEIENGKNYIKYQTQCSAVQILWTRNLWKGK